MWLVTACVWLTGGRQRGLFPTVGNLSGFWAAQHHHGWPEPPPGHRCWKHYSATGLCFWLDSLFIGISSDVQLQLNIVVVIDCIYIELVSALMQTGCAHVAYDSEWGTVSFYSAFFNINQSGVLTVLFGCYVASATWNCFCLGACSSPWQGLPSCPLHHDMVCHLNPFTVTRSLILTPSLWQGLSS